MFKVPSWLKRKKSTRNDTRPLNSSNAAFPSQTTSAQPRSAPDALPFQHPLYALDNDGMIRLKGTNKQLDESDIAIHQDEILNAVVTYIHDVMKIELGFKEEYLPSNDPSIKCDIFVSSNYSTCKKLLVFVAVSRGLSPGLWSRGLILNSGIKNGSMLNYFRKAMDEGYGIIVANPNKNAVLSRDANNSNRKIPIPNSATPEEHMESIWDHFIQPFQAKRVYFIGYSYGGVLIKHLLQIRGDQLLRRNGAVALIESNHRIEDGDSQTVKSILAHRSMYWEVNTDVPFQHKLSGDAPHRTGCTCLSAGKPPRILSNHYYTAAFCIQNTMDGIFRFLSIRDATTFVEAELNFIATLISRPQNASRDDMATSGNMTALDTMNSSNNLMQSQSNIPVNPQVVKLKRSASDGKFMNQGSEKHCNLCLFHFTLFDRRHHCRMCHRAVCNACSRDRLFLPGSSTAQRVCTDCASDGSRQFQNNTSNEVGRYNRGQSDGTFVDTSYDRNRSTSINANNTSGNANGKNNSKLSVEDFDLLKVIGKGAFGKVMLVRKKPIDNEPSNNAIYAMKVLKKINVFAKNQVEHTKSERRILRDIDHPFVVRLRYAFQTEDKLYLVMDYYNGGTLFFHLRKSRKFMEKRARFYAAQLLLAMAHLHELNIAYRDLKLENILMDDKGYIALTDFGLSKENVDVPDGAKTFCGTAEYIAPELLKGLPYGKAVDWWGFGTLLFEMMTGQTPFFDRNRKKMFHNILQRDVIFPPIFSEDAKSLLVGLLRKDPAKRLGSGPSGAQEIMDHPFFASIDWDLLARREIEAPFKPAVTNDVDTTNVANVFTREIPRDSPVTQQLGATHKAQAHFEGFTYMPGTELNGH